MARTGPQLRPHQRHAVTAAVSTLRTHPRASVIAACGTGKTLIAARTATRLAPTGRVLVIVPTVDLLAQTLHAWHAAGRKGRTVAVCSSRQAVDQEPTGPGTPMTTSPAELAAVTAPSGPVTVYATYASLPTLLAAHHHYQLPAWHLLVIDEAHRTAGQAGKAWAAVHHDDQLPATRRLYLTATPRIWDPDHTSDTSTPTAASMDDEALFGPVAYELTLSDAIDLGLLADYQILVPTIDNTTLRDHLATAPGAGEDGLRLAGRQIALLRALHDHHLRRVLTFHHRVADARVFATTLADTASTLPAHQRPHSLWAQWTSGSQPTGQRRQLLRAFGSHTDPDAPAVLSNARVLGEGIDVPAIDAVVFVDPKTSPIDTVQAVGRALRQPPGAGKKATLLVPVYLTPDDDPDDLLNADAYTPLWRTLQALRAHDARLEARLADPRTHRPTTGPEDPDAWLRFDHPARADEVALALSLRVLAPKSAEWRRGLQAARRYHATHAHLDVPQALHDPDGYPLGRWLAWQRHLRTTGALDEARTRALEDLGILWNPRHQAFECGAAHAAAYAARHGHLAVPVGEESDGFPLGRWMATQRRNAARMSTPRAALLSSLDPCWNPPWPLTWQRSYHAARQELLEDHQAPAARQWLRRQRARAKDLHPGQRRLAAELEGAPPPTPEPGALPARERRFQRALAAARAFHEREGHLRVPQRHIEEFRGEPVRLGQWLTNLRRRKEHLSAQRIAALDELGMEWTRP